MVIKKNLGVTKVTKHSFDFAITTYCQAKCRSCARTNEKTGEKEDWLQLQHMDLEVFKRRIENTKLDIDEIVFCGEMGDPMMHPQIDDFIDVAMKHSYEVTINTNGGLRNPEWYARLADKYWNKDLYIHFAIDGTDHETNWEYREGVDWQRAMDNMQAWADEEGQGSWQFLIFEWNWHQIPTAIEMAEKLNIKLWLKLNNRQHGLISDDNLKYVYKILEDTGYEMQN
jgi:MoaA/NifB/PqqE/SkfB family radical SAM enzyme